MMAENSSRRDHFTCIKTKMEQEGETGGKLDGCKDFSGNHYAYKVGF